MTTKAGQLLLMSGLTFHSGRRLADHPDLLAAIETEAVAAERARISDGVRGLPPIQPTGYPEPVATLISRAAVLAIVEPD